MNLRTRMPIWESWESDPIRASWLAWLLFGNLLWCVVDLLGLVGFSFPALSIIGTCLLVASSVALAFGFSLTGGGAGLFAWSAFMCATVAGPRPDYSGLVLAIGMVGFNALIVVNVGTGQDADREAKQRRG